MSIYDESVLRPGGFGGLEVGILEWTDGCNGGGGEGGGGKVEEIVGEVGVKLNAFFRSFLILS